MLHPTSLLILVLTLGASAQVVRYVKPKDSSTLSCPGQPCLTLGQYIFTQQPMVYFTTGSTFVFLAGNHSLDFAVTLANVTDVVFRSIGNVNFICGNGVSILFENITRLRIEGMRFLFSTSYPTYMSVMMLHHSHQVQIANSVFQGNPRKRSRAIYSAHSTVMVTNCSFEGTRGNNGGAMRSLFSTLGLYQSSFSGNAAYKGGAISTFDSILRITSCSFVGNSANDSGGAISAASTVIDVTDSSFNQNKARIRGGAIFSVESNVSLLQNLCVGNTVQMRGGAVSASRSNLNATRNAFVSNNASYKGGAIDVVESSIVLTNNTFANNGADLWGGAVYANESFLHLLGNLFTGNDVNISGSAIYFTNSSLYRNETSRNVFKFNRGGLVAPIVCKSCGIASTSGKSGFKKSAHLARFGYTGIISAPATVAIYSNSKAPGDSFVGIIASPNETKIVLTVNSTQGGEQYMLYSIMNPTSLAFYKRSGRPTLLRGINDILNFGKAMKSDLNFYTNLGTAINGQCSKCNLKLMGIGYFANNNIMPVYYNIA